MTEEDLEMLNRILDAPPGTFTVREIIEMNEIYCLRIGPNSEFLKKMNQKALNNYNG